MVSPGTVPGYVPTFKSNYDRIESNLHISIVLVVLRCDGREGLNKKIKIEGRKMKLETANLSFASATL